MAVGTDGILVGRLSADTKPFISSIQEAIRSLSALGQNVDSSVVRHVKDATDSLNNMGKAAENLGNKMKTSMKMDQGADALKLMKQAYKELTTAQNEYLKAYRSGNGSGMSYFSEQANEAKKLIQFLKEYADMLNRHGSISSDTYKKMQTAYHQYETSVLEGEKKVSSEMKKTYDEYDKKAAAAQKAADAAQKAAAKEAQAYQTDQINKAKNALKDLTDGINKYNQAKKQGDTDAMNFYQNQINQANSVLTLMKQNIDNLGLEEETRNKILKIIQDSTLAMNGFNNAQNQGQAYLKNLSDSWTRIYSVLRMITGISLVKIFRDATTYIKEMDAALVDVSVITGQTTAQTKELGETYRQMASDLQVSSVDIAKSAATIYRQGISDANEVQAVVQGAVKFGAVTGQTTAAAIQSMTASMQNFRKEGEDIGVFVEHIGDVWSYMGDSVATTGAEISVAMDKTAASLSTVGVEFEQASAMAAIMLARTQQAGQVIGTQLNSIASRYMKITSKGYASVTSDDEGEALNFNDISKALSKAGIEMYDTATKTFKPMWDVLKELASGWDELDEATQRYIATQIGSTRGMNYFLTLMNNFDDVLGLAEGSFNDVMDTKYDAWLEGVTAAQNNLTNSMENLYSKIGSGILKDFYNGAASIVDGFTDATAAIGGFNIKAVAGIAALFGIASGISKIITTIQAASSVQGFLSMLTGGQIGLIIAGVATALTAVGAIVNEISKSRSAERLQEIQESMKLNDQEISKWSTIKLQLEDLGDKTTYTAEEMQTFDNIRKSIVESSPSLVAVYGEEGEAIKGYAEAYDIVLNKQKEALRYRQALLEQGYRDTMYGDGKKGDTSFRSQAGSYFESPKDFVSLNDYSGLSAYDRDLIMFGNEDFSNTSLFALRQYMEAVENYINSSEYKDLSEKELAALDANYERLKNALVIKESEWKSLVAEFVPQMFGMLTQDQAAVIAENDASGLFNSMFEALLLQYDPNTFDMSAIEEKAKEISRIFIAAIQNGFNSTSIEELENVASDMYKSGLDTTFIDNIVNSQDNILRYADKYISNETTKNAVKNAIKDGVSYSVLQGIQSGVQDALSQNQDDPTTRALVQNVFAEYLNDILPEESHIKEVEVQIEPEFVVDEEYIQEVREALEDLNTRKTELLQQKENIRNQPSGRNASKQISAIDEELALTDERIEQLQAVVDEFEEEKARLADPLNYEVDELTQAANDYATLIAIRDELQERMASDSNSSAIGVKHLSDYEINEAQSAADAYEAVQEKIDDVRKNYGQALNAIGFDTSEAAETTISAMEKFEEASKKTSAIEDIYDNLDDISKVFSEGKDQDKIEEYTGDLAKLSQEYGFLHDTIKDFIESGDPTSLSDALGRILHYENFKEAQTQINLMSEAINKLNSGNYDDAYLNNLIKSFPELIGKSPKEMVEWMNSQMPVLINQWKDYAETIGQSTDSYESLEKAYGKAIKESKDTRSEEQKIVDSIHQGNEATADDLTKIARLYENLSPLVRAYAKALDDLHQGKGTQEDVDAAAQALYSGFMSAAAAKRAAEGNITRDDLAKSYYDKASQYESLLKKLQDLKESGATNTSSIFSDMTSAGLKGFMDIDTAIVQVTNHLPGFIKGWEEATGLTWDTEDAEKAAESLIDQYKNAVDQTSALDKIYDNLYNAQGKNVEINDETLKQLIELGKTYTFLNDSIEEYINTGNSTNLLKDLARIKEYTDFNEAKSQIDLLRKALGEITNGELSFSTMNQLMEEWGDQLTTDNVADWAGIIRGILSGLIEDWGEYADSVGVSIKKADSSLLDDYKSKSTKKTAAEQAIDRLMGNIRGTETTDLSGAELKAITDEFESLMPYAESYAKSVDSYSDALANGASEAELLTLETQKAAAAAELLNRYDKERQENEEKETAKKAEEAKQQKATYENASAKNIYDRIIAGRELMTLLEGLAPGESTAGIDSKKMKAAGFSDEIMLGADALDQLKIRLPILERMWELMTGYELPETEDTFSKLKKAFEDAPTEEDVLEKLKEGQNAQQIGEDLLKEIGTEHEELQDMILDFIETGDSTSLIDALSQIVGNEEFFKGMEQIEKIINAMNALSSGELDSDTLEGILELARELGIEIGDIENLNIEDLLEALGVHLDGLTKKWKAFASAMGITIHESKSLSEQTKELMGYQSDSEKALEKLSNHQKLNAKELAAIGKQYPNMIKYVNDYANGLDDGATLMNKLSKEIAKSKIAAWSKDVKSAIKELKEAKVGTIEYDEAMRELGEAFNFNGLIDGAEFARQNLDLIAKAADGSTEAFMRLQEAAFIEVIGSSSADFSAVQNGLYATEAEAINAMNALQAAGMGTVEYITLPVDATEMVAVPDGLGGFKLHPQTIKANTTVAVWKPAKSAPTTSTKKSSGGSKSGGGGSKTGASNYASKKTQKNLDQADSMVGVHNPALNIIRLKENYHSQRGETASLASYTQLEAEYLKRQNSIILSEMRYLEDEAHRYTQIMDNTRAGSSKFTKAQTDYTAIAEKLDDYNSTLIENKTRIAEITQELKDYQEQMRQTTITVQDTIRETIQARIDYQRSIRDATVDMEDTIREAIEARYEREKDLAIETLEKKRDAIQQEIDSIDKLIEEREKLFEKEEDENEIAELQAKIARIAADPTRQKELMELQEELAEKQKDLAMKRWKEDLQAQKDLLTQQQTEIDEGIDKIEEDYENLLNNPKQIIAEMEAVISEADDMIVLWLSKNMDEFTTYTQNKQDQVKESWRETLDAMRGYTETYNSQIAQIMGWSSGDIISWLSKMDPTFATSTQEQKESMLYNWASMLDDWRVQDTEAIRNIDPYIDPFWVTSTGIENHETQSGLYDYLVERGRTSTNDYLWDDMNDIAREMRYINIPGLTSINTSDVFGGTGEVTVGTINVNVESLNEDQDYQELARRIGEALNEELRNTGTVGGLKL